MSSSRVLHRFKVSLHMRAQLPFPSHSSREFFVNISTETFLRHSVTNTLSWHLMRNLSRLWINKRTSRGKQTPYPDIWWWRPIQTRASIHQLIALPQCTVAVRDERNCTDCTGVESNNCPPSYCSLHPPSDVRLLTSPSHRVAVACATACICRVEQGLWQG